jgi:hypothetical protein
MGHNFISAADYGAAEAVSFLAESFRQPVQSFVKFDIFGSFLGLVAQRGWTKGFFIEKPTLKSGTEANRGT